MIMHIYLQTFWLLRLPTTRLNLLGINKSDWKKVLGVKGAGSLCLGGTRPPLWGTTPLKPLGRTLSGHLMAPSIGGVPDLPPRVAKVALNSMLEVKATVSQPMDFMSTVDQPTWPEVKFTVSQPTCLHSVPTSIVCCAWIIASLLYPVPIPTANSESRCPAWHHREWHHLFHREWFRLNHREWPHLNHRKLHHLYLRVWRHPDHRQQWHRWRWPPNHREGRIRRCSLGVGARGCCGGWWWAWSSSSTVQPSPQTTNQIKVSV